MNPPAAARPTATDPGTDPGADPIVGPAVGPRPESEARGQPAVQRPSAVQGGAVEGGAVEGGEVEGGEVEGGAVEGGAVEGGEVVALHRAGVVVGGRRIWSEVTLSVRSGEFVAVLGPNGVGKSTLLKALLGLIPVSAGEVSVLGARPGRRGAAIGYLPQRRAFDPGVRVRGVDVVRLGWDGDRWGVPLPWPLRGARARAARDRVEEVIDLVGASAYAGRPIGQCSGGEQQRLLIAQALVRRPKLLLLDEPLDSLDVTNQASVSALVQSVCRSEGVAVVLVAHDVNPILPYLDRVIYLAHGGAVMGPPGQVITADTLTMLYGTPIDVLSDREGRLVVVGQPDHPADHSAGHTAGHRR